MIETQVWAFISMNMGKLLLIIAVELLKLRAVVSSTHLMVGDTTSVRSPTPTKNSLCPGTFGNSPSLSVPVLPIRNPPHYAAHHDPPPIQPIPLPIKTPHAHTNKIAEELCSVTQYVPNLHAVGQASTRLPGRSRTTRGAHRDRELIAHSIVLFVGGPWPLLLSRVPSTPRRDHQRAATLIWASRSNLCRLVHRPAIAITTPCRTP
jgi:hypothetical protein